MQVSEPGQGRQAQEQWKEGDRCRGAYHRCIRRQVSRRHSSSLQNLMRQRMKKESKEWDSWKKKMMMLMLICCLMASPSIRDI